jgi:uncharacterized membrane-anchored protein
VRRWIALAAGVVILVAANYTIYRREALLSGGRVVLLELAPVDPRSLMQGDYMALRFGVADAILDRARAGGAVRDGFLILLLDERGVGSVARVDDRTPLASNEVRMRFRIRGDTVRFATDAFFFQEGTAQRYEDARYGEFRLDAAGDSILTGLRGKDLEPLGER